MSPNSIFQATQYVALISDIMRNFGIDLEIGSDFKRYKELISVGRPEQQIGEPFDADLVYLTETNSYYVAGFNAAGELVHTQAMRKLDLAGGYLSDYLIDQFRHFPPAGLSLDIEASEYLPGPAAKKIKGEIAYHGDVWLKGGDSGFRGTGVSSLLARFAIVLTKLIWSPDYVVAFMPESVAFSGLAERESYMHNEARSLRWHFENSDDVLEGFLIWLSEEDIEHVISVPIEKLLR